LSLTPGPRLRVALLSVSLMLTACALSDPAPAEQTRRCGAGWTAVGSLKASRELHRTAVVSAGGSVRLLLIGGRGAAGAALASVESYDVTSHVVTAAASMTVGRWGHSATVLTDGRVLVAGGFTAQGPASSVELYDPTTNSWSAGPKLAAGRYQHAAVALVAPLRVLVVGGFAATAGATLGSAELLDVGQQIWQTAGALIQGRADHSATVLTDGRVLVAGGAAQANKLGSTELFDPQTLSWTPGPVLSATRRGHAAARLMDGSVLIAGGESAAVDLFTAAPDRVLALPGLGEARTGLTLSAVAGNKAVLVGGLGSSGAATPFSAVLVFDGASRTWDTTDSTINTPRSGHLATLLATGRILISGGRDQGGTLASLELSKAYGAPPAPGDAGARDGDGDVGAGDGDGPNAVDGGDGAIAGEGCSCSTGGGDGPGSALLWVFLLGFSLRRRVATASPRRCGARPPSAGGSWRS